MGSSSQFVLGGVSAVEDVGAAGLGEAVPGPVDERFDPGPCPSNEAGVDAEQSPSAPATSTPVSPPPAALPWPVLRCSCQTPYIGVTADGPDLRCAAQSDIGAIAGQDGAPVEDMVAFAPPGVRVTRRSRGAVLPPPNTIGVRVLDPRPGRDARRAPAGADLDTAPKYRRAAVNRVRSSRRPHRQGCRPARAEGRRGASWR